MACPFPGMDPYLEGPEWTSFHGQFCAEIARRLTPVLGDRYVAMLERRVTMDILEDITISERVFQPDVSVLRKGIPGAAVMERSAPSVMEPPMRIPVVMEVETPVHFVEIREVASKTLVTVIEVLSPANKRGEGREEYLQKRRSIFKSEVNLIEIDLLRGGERVPMQGLLPDAAYFALVHRSRTYPVADVWPIGLKEPLPAIPVPLLRPDPDAALDLGAVFTGAYLTVDFSRVLDYSRPLKPPLAEDDERWVGEMVGARC